MSLKDNWEIIEGDGYPNIGWGNGEAQCYKKENVQFLDDGTIIITAKEEQCHTPQNFWYNYSSGKIKSKQTCSVKKGHVEATIAVKAEHGIWPAFWMLPVGEETTWPKCGEIDIFEAKGRLANSYFGSLHYLGAYNMHTCKSFTQEFIPGHTINIFHTYALDWDEKEIRWYCDNKLIESIKKKDLLVSDKNPFLEDKQFYVIINLAVGGSFDNFQLPPMYTLPCQMIIQDIKIC